ncbi:F-box/FBD/LRR-repeat protein At1g13570-like [Magnolia sinica]|uniref:F-box/FBD/LRR-repeat protein At1g13570-like n=1 Tax=Magnolia sinica TaxID=86752 RepID=UPI002658D4D4|nr:F-box/FBD/LRR-repeat protein At1g13570-like [Magnolia sinica]
MEASNPHHEMEIDQVQFQNLDMITYLPPNVIDIILMCLPLRDAVRTSILSCDWRYKWVKIPRLSFDQRSFPPGCNELKIVNAVDQVLLVHRGPIQEFKCQNYLKNCPAIDRWILLLSDNGMKRFTLDLLQSELAGRYKLPSCLFRCKSLIHLQISYCIFKPPSKLVGLHCLKTLHLRDVTIDNSFEDLISKFPFLEELTLWDFDGPTCLKIQGPKLLYLNIRCRLKYLYFENVPLVAIACVHMSLPYRYKKSKESNLIKVLGCLHGVKRLTLNGFLLQFLAAGDVAERLPTPYNCLKNMSLSINFENLDDLLVAFCLFRSSPNLHELEIYAYPAVNTTSIPHESFWEVQEGFDGLFANLRIVTITNIIGSKNELRFVELVLAIAPVLEKMNIKNLATEAHTQLRICRDLLGFRRASPYARINFFGPRDGRTDR